MLISHTILLPTNAVNQLIKHLLSAMHGAVIDTKST